jgi:hypothetical protein
MPLFWRIRSVGAVMSVGVNRFSSPGSTGWSGESWRC